jgi:glycosyltransferase involved in cell wall biosynthesis
VLAGLFVKRPDVVIATSPQFFCGWAGVILGKLRRRRFILEIRDIWPDSIVAVGTSMPKPLIRMLEFLELKMYKAADTIVTVGDGYKEQLVVKKVPAGKIEVITNGADTTIFKPSPKNQSMVSQYGLKDKFVCSYVGTIGMACGLDVVINAAEKLRSQNNSRIVFLLVGDGARRHELEQMAKEEKLNNVIFAGMLPKKDIPGILSVSDVSLIHLIKKDLFKSVLPSKIFEAAAMKNPIIIGVQGYAADFVRKIGAGICVEPENTDELLDALEKISGNSELAEQLGRNGYENITKYYTREALAEKYLGILNQR